MLERIQELVDNEKSFAIESTLSGLIYQKLVSTAKNNNYTVVLFFVYLNSANLAKERVSIRVSKGGHNIPDNVIVRRYLKGLRNFNLYADLVNSWYIYDNSGFEYVLVAKNIEGKKEIFNFELYNKICQQ